MADQDFNIKVVTTADTSGLRATSSELDAIKRKAESATAAMNKQAADAEAKWSSSPLNPKNATGGIGVGVGAGAGAAAGAGLSGTAVGIGTIVTLLTLAINKWKDFNDELDRSAELSLVAIAKFRELGESVLDIQDKVINARRLGTEPLQFSFERLTQDVARLKVEMGLAMEAGELEDWKKLNAELNTAQSQLNGVTAALQREKAEADKATQSELEKRVPGLKPQDTVKQADAQTQRILMNEQAAAKARAEGRDADADMFEKSAERYKASATPAQLADLQRIHELQEKLKGQAAPTYQPLSPEEFARRSAAEQQPGFSSEEMRQRQLDARADRYQGIQKTRAEGIKAEEDRNEDLKDFNNRLRQQGAKPITEAQKQAEDLKRAIEDLGKKFDRYWG